MKKNARKRVLAGVGLYAIGAGALAGGSGHCASAGRACHGGQLRRATSALAGSKVLPHLRSVGNLHLITSFAMLACSSQASGPSRAAAGGSPDRPTIFRRPSPAALSPGTLRCLAALRSPHTWSSGATDPNAQTQGQGVHIQTNSPPKHAQGTVMACTGAGRVRVCPPQATQAVFNTSIRRSHAPGFADCGQSGSRSFDG